jgi:hypothetical protein
MFRLIKGIKLKLFVITIIAFLIGPWEHHKRLSSIVANNRVSSKNNTNVFGYCRHWWSWTNLIHSIRDANKPFYISESTMFGSFCYDHMAKARGGLVFRVCVCVLWHIVFWFWKYFWYGNIERMWCNWKSKIKMTGEVRNELIYNFI